LKTFIEVDTKFLARKKLMDYSLLLVIEEVQGDLIKEKELVSKKTEDLDRSESIKESEKSNSLTDKN
jgi:Phosphatidylinositol-4-phosphate 5-Kinase